MSTCRDLSFNGRRLPPPIFPCTWLVISLETYVLVIWDFLRLQYYKPYNTTINRYKYIDVLDKSFFAFIKRSLKWLHPNPTEPFLLCHKLTDKLDNDLSGNTFWSKTGVLLAKQRQHLSLVTITNIMDSLLLMTL